MALLALGVNARNHTVGGVVDILGNYLVMLRVVRVLVVGFFNKVAPAVEGICINVLVVNQLPYLETDSLNGAKTDPAMIGNRSFQ